MGKEDLVILEYEKRKNKIRVRKLTDDDFEIYKVDLENAKWNYFNIKTTPIGQGHPTKQFNESNLTLVEREHANPCTIGIYDSNEEDHLTNMVYDGLKIIEQRNSAKNSRYF